MQTLDLLFFIWNIGIFFRMYKTKLNLFTKISAPKFVI